MAYSSGSYHTSLLTAGRMEGSALYLEGFYLQTLAF